METPAITQDQPQPRTLDADWAEAEWFAEWLRLARREYQGCLDLGREFQQAA